MIARMRDVYAGAATYRDTGTAVTRWTALGGATREARCDFATAFARPDRLRVTSWNWFGAALLRQVVWCGEGGANVWRPRGGTQPPKPLAHALLTSLDLSQRLALSVLGALADDLISNTIHETLSNLHALCALPDDVCDGRLCHRVRVRCSHWSESATEDERETIAEALLRLRELTGREVPNVARYFPLTLWIDGDTFLVRRLTHTILEADRASEVDVRFDPEVNVTLAESELTFDPAKSGAT